MLDFIRTLALWARVTLARHPRTPQLEPATSPHRVPAIDLPAHRSPYGLDGPLNGNATPLVRPYVRAQEQRERRFALVLAADFGVDLDTHLIGAPGAA
ncbi:hypothetical protein QCN29_00550 [Streptomyces sp. HNM0663]|uniref:Uncharacterized protein n=1 Tax=Streptomyces chengmaiensis TaxID=3040919 RepID=A0ABT6HEW1_9ACTN|nr:hypothetical protein [Streptomyces chengmaiensis]MDH2387299.1 hypothetical protein [Streptomyces chengmaiensis]